MSNMQQLPLRIPADLKDKVRAAAAEEGRSMNAQIVQHLRAVYEPKVREEETA